jgi:hypothetical protein
MINNKHSNMVVLSIEKELMILEKEDYCKPELSIGEASISNLFQTLIPMVLMEIAQ